MPGSSRIPASLRETLNTVKRTRPSNPLQVLNIEL